MAAGDLKFEKAALLRDERTILSFLAGLINLPDNYPAINDWAIIGRFCSRRSLGIF